MSRQGNFMIYCAEQYKASKKLKGKQIKQMERTLMKKKFSLFK